MFFVSGAE